MLQVDLTSSREADPLKMLAFAGISLYNLENGVIYWIHERLLLARKRLRERKNGSQRPEYPAGSISLWTVYVSMNWLLAAIIVIHCGASRLKCTRSNNW